MFKDYKRDRYQMTSGHVKLKILCTVWFHFCKNNNKDAHTMKGYMLCLGVGLLMSFIFLLSIF